VGGNAGSGSREDRASRSVLPEEKQRQKKKKLYQRTTLQFNVTAPGVMEAEVQLHTSKLTLLVVG